MTTERVVGSGTDRRTEADRRTGRARVRFPERRLGFDRRVDPSIGRARLAYRAWVGRISGSPVRAAVLMGSIVALNVADIAFTFAALERGVRELNPVMVGLLDAGHGVAAFVKIGVSAVLAGAGWWFRRFRRVIVAALGVALLMSALFLYHLAGLAVS